MKVCPVVEQPDYFIFDALYDVGGHFFPNGQDVISAEIVVGKLGDS